MNKRAIGLTLSAGLLLVGCGLSPGLRNSLTSKTSAAAPSVLPISPADRALLQHYQILSDDGTCTLSGCVAITGSLHLRDSSGTYKFEINTPANKVTFTTSTVKGSQQWPIIGHPQAIFSGTTWIGVHAVADLSSISTGATATFDLYGDPKGHHLQVGTATISNTAIPSPFPSFSGVAALNPGTQLFLDPDCNGTPN